MADENQRKSVHEEKVSLFGDRFGFIIGALLPVEQFTATLVSLRSKKNTISLFASIEPFHCTKRSLEWKRGL